MIMIQNQQMRAGGGDGLAGGEGLGGTEPPTGKRRSTVNNFHPSPTLSTTEHSHTHPRTLLSIATPRCYLSLIDGPYEKQTWPSSILKAWSACPTSRRPTSRKGNRCGLVVRYSIFVLDQLVDLVCEEAKRKRGVSSSTKSQQDNVCFHTYGTRRTLS